MSTRIDQLQAEIMEDNQKGVFDHVKHQELDDLISRKYFGHSHRERAEEIQERMRSGVPRRNDDLRKSKGDDTTVQALRKRVAELESELKKFRSQNRSLKKSLDEDERDEMIARLQKSLASKDSLLKKAHEELTGLKRDVNHLKALAKAQSPRPRQLAIQKPDKLWLETRMKLAQILIGLAAEGQYKGQDLREDVYKTLPLSAQRAIRNDHSDLAKVLDKMNKALDQLAARR